MSIKSALVIATPIGFTAVALSFVDAASETAGLIVSIGLLAALLMMGYASGRRH